MIIALVTGQRRSDIVAIQRSDIKDVYLFIEQYKTGAKIVLPLNLYCEKLDMTLKHVINNICTGKKLLIKITENKLNCFR